MRALKYLAFLVAVFSFMAFARYEEVLTPDETLALSQFETQIALEAQRSPTVASEVATPLPSTTTLIASDATIPAVAAQPKPNGYILEDSVNVRTGPGLDFPVVTQLYKWDNVLLGNLANGWYEITINGQILYVSSDFATLSPFQ